MLQLRPSEARGHADHGWLNARHSFSFGQYYDPEHTGFGPLLVINEDRIHGGKGFAPHGHRDMEIITYVLDGELEHQDSMGHRSILRPGDVQRMSAGTGIQHSEYNHHPQHPLHLLQIWIHPNCLSLPPSYEEKTFPADSKKGRLALIASEDGREGSLRIHQNASLHAAILEQGDTLHHPLAPGRNAYLHLIRGTLTANGQPLQGGDALKLINEPALTLEHAQNAELLLFDLPAAA